MIEGLTQQKEECSAVVDKFSKVFDSVAGKMSPSIRERTACRLVCRKLVHEALVARKSAVGVLLSSLRKICGIQLNSEDDLQIHLHTPASEPYFYDTAHRSSAPKEVTVVDRDSRCIVSEPRSPEPHEIALYSMVIPVDERGRCVLAEEVGTGRTTDARPKSWRCCELCKQLTDEEISEILLIKLAFERPLEEVRAFLQEFDCGCEHGHCSKRLLDDELIPDGH